MNIGAVFGQEGLRNLKYSKIKISKFERDRDNMNIGAVFGQEGLRNLEYSLSEIKIAKFERERDNMNMGAVFGLGEIKIFTIKNKDWQV